MQTPLLIVGLGNVGERYARTRHNAGFIVVDAIAAATGAAWHTQKKHHALVARPADSRTVFLAKPTTMMNASGRSVAALAAYYDIPPARIVVIHDDSDLMMGDRRLQRNRGAAGHNGVADIIRALGTKDFWRLRIGVRERERDAAGRRISAMAFVLGAMPSDALRDLTAAAATLYREILATCEDTAQTKKPS